MVRVIAWLLAVVSATLAFADVAAARSVSCLGRIEPHDGVYRLAGPSDLAVVAEMRVAEGDVVERGQVLATLDTHGLLTAEVQRAQVELDHARRVLKRNAAQGSFQSQAAIEEAERDVELREAELVAARARLDRASVRAPVDGQVLTIHAREGERIGQDGLLELGRTQEMYVVAEVYETDIARVAKGQRVLASSPALGDPVTGVVERIGMLVAKNDALDLDPVARTDSRIVEVFVKVDEPERVAGLTNLQVEVEIGE